MGSSGITGVLFLFFYFFIFLFFLFLIFYFLSSILYFLFTLYSYFLFSIFYFFIFLFFIFCFYFLIFLLFSVLNIFYFLFIHLFFICYLLIMYSFINKTLENDIILLDEISFINKIKNNNFNKLENKEISLCSFRFGKIEDSYKLIIGKDISKKQCIIKSDVSYICSNLEINLNKINLNENNLKLKKSKNYYLMKTNTYSNENINFKNTLFKTNKFEKILYKNDICLDIKLINNWFKIIENEILFVEKTTLSRDKINIENIKI